MKSLVTLCLALILTPSLPAQVSGNINYQERVKFSDNNINVRFPSSSDLLVNVKGLANVEADSYVAIFNVSQVGETTEEVNRLIDERIARALDSIKTKPDVETYIDMISFVPMYEYESEKKIFSKRTYNEIPAGFEIKKNIHIKYSDPDFLNEIIPELSRAEIYELIRVDYFSTELEAIKKELMSKARTVLKRKLKDYASILSVDMASVEKQLVDGFKVILPVENYKSYNAYSSSSLNLKKPATVNQAEKSSTLYYQPVIDKEFDFVMNPTILRPVIQVMYEIKLKVNREEAKTRPQKTRKEYILLTPDGNTKSLNLP
jgi:uncharacterized protein YggE